MAFSGDQWQSVAISGNQQVDGCRSGMQEVAPQAFASARLMLSLSVLSAFTLSLYSLTLHSLTLHSLTLHSLTLDPLTLDPLTWSQMVSIRPSARWQPLSARMKMIT